MIFSVTVDTEADNQWETGTRLTTENVRFWEPFQMLCEKHGCPPTYLVTHEIAADARAQRSLIRWAQRGSAEIGAHLHVWTTPPYVDSPGLRFNDPIHAYQRELPTGLVAEKLARLTSHIEERLGARPSSFRAGRFGIDGHSAKELASQGYVVDSSITPLVGWGKHPGLAGPKGAPDHRGHSARPFIVEDTGDPGLLELPITIVPTYEPLRRSPALLALYGSTPARAARRALFSRWLCPQPVWLQPAPFFRPADLSRAFDRHCLESDVAVMIFHSSELMPGGSPYRRTETSVRELLEMLDGFFSYVRMRGAKGVTLSEAARQVRGAHGLIRKPL